jgi:predicted DsbA family dithiol-disulfide isomerase
VRTDRLKEEFDLEIRWRAFPLHPETPDEGQSLEQLFAGRYDINSMLLRCLQVAEELSLPFGNRTQTFNSRRAQELGKWAEEQGKGDTFHMTVYRAYFVDGLNIAQPVILGDIAAETGLDRKAALDILNKRVYAPHVDSDWRRASELGITAVPTSIYQTQKLVGFQSYENYRSLIR